MAATWAVAALSGCGAGRPTPNPLGGACEGTEECVAGLECKAARCAPPLSGQGGVCVTDRGCNGALVCLRGRCSTGPASRTQCTEACAHMRGLMATELRAGAPPPPEDQPPSEEEQLILLNLEDFELRCFRRCVERSASLEDVECLLSSQTLLQVRACP